MLVATSIFLKIKTSNNIIQRLEGVAREARIGNDKIEQNQIDIIIKEELDKAQSALYTIAMSESTKARNLGMTMDISRAAAADDEKDPTVGFAVIRDNTTCPICIKLCLMSDGVTPKLFKLSELSAGYYVRGEQFPSILGQHPHCFTGSQRIATDLGLFTFKELFESQLEPKVLIDYRIKNRTETGNQFGKPIPGSIRLDPHSKSESRFEQATSVYETGIQEVLKFTLDTGQELEVSLGHEMWTETGNSVWSKVEAKKMLIGDKVPLITNGESFGFDHFPLEAELMGNLLGDGSLGVTAEWNFFGNDIPYGEKLFNIAKTISPHGKFLDNLRISSPDNKYNVPRASFHSGNLRKLFVEEYGLTKKPRRIPSRLFRADKQTVSAFLRGLYAADGHSELGSIILAQNDLCFLKEIQLLLSMFGHVSRIFEHGKATQKIITYADGTEYLTERKDCWRLVLGGSVQFERFVYEIGFGVPVKQELAISRLTEKSQIRNYWRTAKIEKIENIGLQQTYCLTEPMTNTITVNGIVTGQCRCTIFYVPSDWGFSKEGHLTFVKIGHDELDRQRKV